MSEQSPRPRRPGLYSDLARLVGAEEDLSSWPRSELAAATAAAVVSAGRGSAGEPGADPSRFVTLADEVGLDTMAELWRDAEPDSLPGALWALYLLRTWCRSDAVEIARLWRAGRGLAPADEVVAGVSDDAGPEAVANLADAVLAGAYRADFAVALERAASFFRVIAAGRRMTTPDGPDGDAARERADRNDRAADGLAGAASRWRAGEFD
ncbi:MAG: hypothetical protein ABJA87_08050 [bacterium]